MGGVLRGESGHPDRQSGAGVNKMIVTLVWSAVLALSVAAGVFGFMLNTQTPVGVGPLPAICFAVALVSLIVVIARLAQG